MSLIIPPGYAMITQQWILSGRANPFSVVTGHEVDPADFTDPNLMATAIRNNWAGTLSQSTQMRVGYSLGPCKVLYRNPSGVLEIGENTSVTPGTASPSNSLPPNCSLIITKRTGIAGPKNRGRMYVPPVMLNEGDVDQAGNFSTGGLPALADAWLLAIGSSLRLVLLHTGAEPPTPVSRLSVQGRLATQRRRLR